MNIPKSWRPTLTRWLARTAQVMIKMVLWTCRVEYIGLDRFLKTAQTQACVLMLWHDQLALVAPLFRRRSELAHLPYSAFVSASRDGQLVREICACYPNCRVISVAHHSRHHALRALIQQLQTRQEILLITPDGPRGPRRQMKGGLALAARKAEAPVIPFSWSASRCWRLNTWDQMAFPLPFSKVVVKFGDGVKINEAAEAVEATTDDNRLEEALQAIQD